MSTDHKLCPECGEPKLSAADGVLHCTSCGWSEEDDEPSVIGAGCGLAPMPTQEDFRAAHKAEYIRLFVDVGLDPKTPEAWHDEQWEDIKDMTPQEAFNAEVEYWDGE